MKKYKTILIAAITIIALLSGAWFMGGGGNDSGAVSALNAQSSESAPIPGDADMEDTIALPGSIAQPVASGAAGDTGAAVSSDALTNSGTAAPATADPCLDKYQTESIPEGKPAPVEPQDTTVSDDSFTVTLSVRCDTIANHIELLHIDKRELVPEDGVIFPLTEVTAYEGESVFNILQREMKRARIHMEFRNTPIYNSAFIMGIHNLYEMDAGELSGWTYMVNGWFPNYGSSRYQLKPGDAVEWLYTCDLGRDLGTSGFGGWQIDE